eukprot:TRINITY_DN19757_c0_g1_i1.p1 TRINITY_DN19757_c0_g1~~TRINITY_DN19757_c0_g1_i1.p1  ORF type:complete len:346 (-),score=86.34 TRINITY_DN19757_c0_g1_i1:56-1093(-)
MKLSARSGRSMEAGWDEHEFEAHVRRIHGAHGENLAPCVLDITPRNMLNFAGFSSPAMAITEMNQLLPAELGPRVLEWLEQRHKMEAAFCVRRELVNLKKVCLHVVQDGARIEKDLRLAATLFFADLLKTDLPTQPDRDKYMGITSTLSLCRGGLAAMSDARIFTKQICSTARHPEAAALPEHNMLPTGLALHKLLVKVCGFMDVPTPAIANRELEPDEGSARVAAGLMADDVLPGHLAEFVRKVCIARGVCKAIRVRAQLKTLHDAMSDTLAELEVCGERLAELVVEPSHVRRGMHHRMYTVSYTHLRAHETPEHLVCRLLLEKKKKHRSDTIADNLVLHNKNN